MRHARHGAPRAVLRAALGALGEAGIAVVAASPVLASAPLGPSRRQYANGAAVVEATLGPRALLALLQQIERDFGRMRRGQRWSARTLDLDIVLWSGGAWADKALTIPHPAFRERDFVVRPAARIACNWRDPATGLALKHLSARLTRKSRAPSAARRRAP
ncbi:2-amino-4-hydroxy-6-hydroxymethyldihydropteridine diphosphokinase [Novosphingobium olei]|uniref:2-amino-4-hydroxy-6- hydroxymethyldihydropteridine diphosphokinase n=1 Tax=Novosphingobium olei TaxID=2728851 RepID=UPI0030847200|nr:2-amino-4-hydroxy-6-hydroxymethyldihydropteridine diphosphokinase [Novosphingobium olei]